MPWIAAACDTGTVNCVWVEVAGVPYCLAGDHALHLVPVLRAPSVGREGRPLRDVQARRGACGGVAAGDGAAGQGVARTARVPRSALAESIRRAYLAPGGPGEVE